MGLILACQRIMSAVRKQQGAQPVVKQRQAWRKPKAWWVTVTVNAGRSISGNSENQGSFDSAANFQPVRAVCHTFCLDRCRKQRALAYALLLLR